MKTMKKALCLALALVMVMALGMSAWAEPTTEKMTVNNHDFLVYQLLVGTVSAGANGDSVIETADGSGLAWGEQLADDAIRADFFARMAEEATSDVVKAEFAKLNAIETGATPVDLAQALYTIEQALGNGRTATDLTPREALATFAKDMHAILSDGYSGENELKQTANTPVDRTTGYYLLIDMDESVTDDSLKYLLFALSSENKTVNPKTKDTPDMEKKVLDKDGNPGSWAEYEIGDMVPFEITATLPDGYAAKKATYWMTFRDTQDAGLGEPTDIKVFAVKADGTEEELSYNAGAGKKNEYALTTTANGFTIELTNMGDAANEHLAGLTDGDKIIVRYEAELLDNAIIGGVGNANTAKLDYEDGSTPDSTVKVFTFEFDANKVDGTDGNEPLKGAAFSLYRKLDAVPDEVKGKTDAELKETDKYRVDRDADDNITTAYEYVDSIEAGETTTFKFDGLTTGTYRLYEDAAPTGYTPIDPIDFTLEAEYNSTHTEVTKLTMRKDSGNVVDGKDGEGEEDGIISVPIANYKGTVLPETGGIGTTIFYIAGAVLLLGAVILLVTRRRARFDED